MPPPPLQVIAHRGASAYAPENTWASFDLALQIGADAIETDVRATNDGRLVLLHDASLDRTTNGHGPVKDAPWELVAALDAGAWFNPRFAGQRVPLLEPTLARYAPHVHFAIEIKQPGIEAAVLAAIRDSCARATVTAFKFETLLDVRRLDPAIAAGLLTTDISDANITRVAQAGLSQFCPHAKLVNPGLVQRLKNLGLSVRAWGVGTPELMRQAIDAGVDGMTTNWPDQLLTALGRPAGPIALA
ncbi:MAG TPA: glycerophosphodiester phosphodiesterase family protein [Candidatus Brocadiia bacterium]|nr:glycerophosphodiester phosphodiesterase family protein [Candidatus Brocadiia bacterium]